MSNQSNFMNSIMSQRFKEGIKNVTEPSVKPSVISSTIINQPSTTNNESINKYEYLKSFITQLKYNNNLNIPNEYLDNFIIFFNNVLIYDDEKIKDILIKYAAISSKEQQNEFIKQLEIDNNTTFGDEKILPSIWNQIDDLFKKIYNEQLDYIEEEENLTKDVEFKSVFMNIYRDITKQNIDITKILDINIFKNKFYRVYNSEFNNFCYEITSIFSNTNINESVKFIKIKNIYNYIYSDNIFKQKLQLHIIILKFITIINYDLIYIELYDTIKFMYTQLHNCEVGLVSPFIPHEIKLAMNKCITSLFSLTDSYTTISNDENTYVGYLGLKLYVLQTKTQDSIGFIRQYLSKGIVRDIFSTPKPTNSEISTNASNGKLSPVVNLKAANLNRREVDNNVILNLKQVIKNKNNIMLAKHYFCLLHNLYKSHNISCANVNFESSDKKNINNIIQNEIKMNDLKKQTSMITTAIVSNINYSQGIGQMVAHKTSIVLYSLGLVGAHITFGLSLVLALVLNQILPKIVNIDYVKVLFEHSSVTSQFRDCITDFYNMNSKHDTELNQSMIKKDTIMARCEPQNKNTLFEKSSEACEGYMDHCNKNYDIIILEFLSFKNVFNLLYDKDNNELLQQQIYNDNISKIQDDIKYLKKNNLQNNETIPFNKSDDIDTDTTEITSESTHEDSIKATKPIILMPTKCNNILDNQNILNMNMEILFKNAKDKARKNIENSYNLLNPYLLNANYNKKIDLFINLERINYNTMMEYVYKFISLNQKLKNDIVNNNDENIPDFLNYKKICSDGFLNSQKLKDTTLKLIYDSLILPNIITPDDDTQMNIMDNNIKKIEQREQRTVTKKSNGGNKTHKKNKLNKRNKTHKQNKTFKQNNKLNKRKTKRH